MNEQEMKWWYNQKMIKWNIYSILKGKYMSIKPSKERGLIRYCKITMPDMLSESLDKWNIQFDSKLYMDIVTWNYLPLFSYIKHKRTEQKDEFNKSFESNINEVDFVIDIDAKKNLKGEKELWTNTHKRAITCMKFLQKNEIPFSVWNSSSNGFQFYVKEGDMKPVLGLIRNPQSKIEKYIKFVKTMRNVNPDLAVYDTRRIIKLPYSLCEGYVVLPLTEEQLRTWTPTMAEPKWVYENITLLNRGIIKNDCNRNN